MDLIKNLVDFVDNKLFLLAGKSKHIKSDYFNYFFLATKNFLCILETWANSHLNANLI